MTSEFEQLLHDPDLQSERGPSSTLVFADGAQYCVIGPDFVSMEESDVVGFGATKAEAVTNYFLKLEAADNSLLVALGLVPSFR